MTPEWRTLRFAALWVFGSIAGRAPGTDPVEDDAFWDALHDLAFRLHGPGGDFLRATAAEGRSALVADLHADARPLASGLFAVATVLDADPETGPAIRAVLIRLARDIATARGPHGRSISRDDAESLALVAEMLDATDLIPA
ncbi:MAG TPA: hypothetical protein VGP36_19875 [Mycobacteriales bacterium]|jgi:hypothetical protein|nr:hypothetical protein [Mycobacteriales bacterium]